MTVLILASAVVLAALVVAGAVLVRDRSADSLLRKRCLDELVVTMTDGQAFRGLLSRTDARTVAFVQAVLLSPSQTDPLPVDGELILPRDRIAYMQRT